jgi:hypothetical protein
MEYGDLKMLRLEVIRPTALMTLIWILEKLYP